MRLARATPSFAPLGEPVVADLIDGRAFAAGLRDDLAAALKAAPAAGLATLAVGEDYRAGAYERRLRKVAGEVALPYRHVALGGDASLDRVAGEVAALNADPGVAGILILRPLPAQIDEGALFRLLDPAKDIEAVHPENAGLLALGTPRFVPSTPAAAFALLDHYLERSGEDRVAFYRRSVVVVVGRSNNVGKPALALAAGRDAMVVSVDEHASAAGRLAELTRLGDVLVVAAGVAGLIGAAHVREGAIVVDIGINPVRDPASGAVRLVGDVDPAVGGIARALTPVPGGVGPVTDVWLARNTAIAAGVVGGG